MQLQTIKKRRLLALLAIFYFIVRLPFLTNLPIFNDEAIYLDWGSRMLHGVVSPFYPLFDGKTPLLMWIFSIAGKLFSDPLLGGRLVSVLVGYLALWGIYKLALKLFDAKVATLATLLYIATPIIAFYDRQALMESSVGAIGIWLFYFLTEYLEKPKLKTAVILGLLAALGFYIKPSALILLIPLFVILLLERKDLLNGAFVFSLTFFAALMPLLFHSNFVAIFSRSGRYISVGISLKGIEIMFWQLFPTTFILAAAGVYLLFKKQRNLILWTVLPLMTSILMAKTVQPRYIVSFVPLLVIPAAYTLKLLRKPGILFLVLPFVATLFLIVEPYDYLNYLSKVTDTSEVKNYYLDWTSGDGINKVREFLQEKAKTGPILVGVRVDAGNPESAMFAYYGSGKNKNITVMYFDSRLVPSGVKNLNFPYPLYFISRGSQLAGMEKYLVERDRLYNKGGNFIGIYEFKK